MALPFGCSRRNHDTLRNTHLVSILSHHFSRVLKSYSSSAFSTLDTVPSSTAPESFYSSHGSQCENREGWRSPKTKNCVFHVFVFTSCLIRFTSLLSVSLTQADLLPWVGGQKEDQQGHGGQQHTRDEEVQGVKQGPSTQSHHEGHVRIGLGAAVIKDFMTTTRDLWRTGGTPPQWQIIKKTQVGIFLAFLVAIIWLMQQLRKQLWLWFMIGAINRTEKCLIQHSFASNSTFLFANELFL